ncbi:MAG TPA: S-adenosylmethionine decarboxylase [Gemmatimonadales bacterium]|nr:S-adenosylmethionine decarboxylase [Gemmatimonadales bacterium]
MRFEHAFADLGGVTRERLSDLQGLGALLLSAANAAGLAPASPPLLKAGPKGVAAALLCDGGHVALHAVPDAGQCYVDLAGLGIVAPRRGLDIIIRRLGAREVRTDARRRGPVTHPLDPETE